MDHASVLGSHVAVLFRCGCVLKSLCLHMTASYCASSMAAKVYEGDDPAPPAHVPKLFCGRPLKVKVIPGPTPGRRLPPEDDTRFRCWDRLHIQGCGEPVCGCVHSKDPTVLKQWVRGKRISRPQKQKCSDQNDAVSASHRSCFVWAPDRKSGVGLPSEERFSVLPHFPLRSGPTHALPTRWFRVTSSRWKPS